MTTRFDQTTPFAKRTDAASRPKQDAESPDRIRGRVAQWFAMMVLVGLASTILFVILAMAFRGKQIDSAFRMTAHGQVADLLRETSYDSWLPMLKAYKRHSADSARSPYSVFFEGQGKFQYPPTALFLAEFLPISTIEQALAKWDGSLLQYWNGWVCRLAIATTIGLTVLIAHSATRVALNGQAISLRMSILLALAVIGSGLTFYPFVVGYQLGQLQLVLNAFIAAALLAFLEGKKKLAGIFFGLCCLVKPQYGLILAWSLLQRERRLSAGFLISVVPTLIISCTYFGLPAHFDYANVLGLLAERGEIFWYNQSLAGLLHRFVDPSQAYFFDEVGSPLPPYRLAVHIASILLGMSLLIYTLGGRSANPTHRNATPIDLAIVVVAATIASPVAWNHHYGALFPVFAAVLPSFLFPSQGRPTLALLLGVAYLAIGLEIFAPEFIFRSRWSGLFGSHIFYGGLLLMLLLVVARRRGAVPKISLRTEI